MSVKAKKNFGENTPIYCLDTFSKKAQDVSLYIEKLSVHLAEHEFISKPHKHDFYLILYITKGGGEHIIDFNTYTISPGRFFLMTPGQIHWWKLAPQTDGFIIFFTRNFYQLQWRDSSLLEFSFFHSLHADPLIKLQDSTLDIVIGEMYNEFKNEEPTDARMLRSYLDLLLLKLARAYKAVHQAPLNSDSFKLRKLEQLIEKNFLKLKQPSDYADLMNLSASYLNTICKQNLNKTLSDLIQDRVILEAKRLLAYTDLTVSQISDQLNFSAPSYLIRYFKKNTGLTPEQFKESIIRVI